MSFEPGVEDRSSGVTRRGNICLTTPETMTETRRRGHKY